MKDKLFKCKKYKTTKYYIKKAGLKTKDILRNYKKENKKFRQNFQTFQQFDKILDKIEDFYSIPKFPE